MDIVSVQASRAQKRARLTPVLVLLLLAFAFLLLRIARCDVARHGVVTRTAAQSDDNKRLSNLKGESYEPNATTML